MLMLHGLLQKRLDTLSLQYLIISAVVIFLLGCNVCASDGLAQGVNSSQISLDIYVDNTGKALVAGYAEDIGGLPLLDASQYQYEKDTNQLYVITNSLTSKYGDEWVVSFDAKAHYEEYHTTFYLPGDVILSSINGSDELNYFVSSSNDSFVVEFYGYDIEDPTIAIEYQQSIQSGIDIPDEGDSSSLLILVLSAILILILLSIVGIKIWPKERPKRDSVKNLVELKRPISAQEPEPVLEIGVSETESFDDKSISDLNSNMPGSESEMVGSNSTRDMDTSVQEQVDEVAEMGKAPSPSALDDRADEKEVPITSEMAAVMETLTERERSVVEVLIGCGGRITQAEIRYETQIPKSSLTGIITSLERRKIVTKKEWGRTNIIELSEWFKSNNKSK